MEIVELIRDNWDAVVAAIGIVGIACESALLALAGLARALRGVAHGLLRLAATTATERDDRIVLSAIVVLEMAAAWLEKAAALVPRLRAGSGRAASAAKGPGATLILPLLMVFGVGAMSGCGGSAEMRARTALDAGARALVTADAMGSEEFRIVEARCYGEPTLSEWRECMRPAFRLEEALRATRAALYGAEAAIDARGESGWQSTAPCVARALGELGEAASTLRLKLPDEVAQLLSIARAVGGSCRGGE